MNDNYIIDQNGNIFSKAKNRYLKPHISKSNGYRMVTLLHNGKKEVCYVHQLVAEKFIDKDYKSKGLVVDHINRIRQDNRLENLRIVNTRDNIMNSSRVLEAKNIYFCETRKKYVAQVKRNKVNYRKRFSTLIEAKRFVEQIKKTK